MASMTSVMYNKARRNDWNHYDHAAAGDAGSLGEVRVEDASAVVAETALA